MAEVRKTGEKGRYWVVDSKCLGRECFQPGAYQHRGAVGAAGTRNTGQVSKTCMRNAYHGCPHPTPEPTAELLRERKAEGWKNA